MSIFNNFNNGNPIIKTILSAFVILLMSKSTELFQNLDIKNMSKKFHAFLYKPNYVILNGDCYAGISKYNDTIMNSNFTERFRSIFDYIYKNVENIVIHEMTELKLSNITDVTEMFIISQDTPFIIDSELQIFAKTSIIKKTSEESNKEKSQIEITQIEINIFSYVSSIKTILEFLEKIKIDYQLNNENTRRNTKFIYTLENAKIDENSLRECWDETDFNTTRSVDNMFFEGKKELIEEILFFQNNKEWYYEKGVPYTMGIGLCGPPGTGKTSLVKAIAKLLNRHIIVLSLKLIKTKKQLNQLFFEDRYSCGNTRKSITFDKKIIVIEDIDCIGDIVKNRSMREESYKKRTNKQNLTESEQVIKTILENVEDNKMCPIIDEEITLDDLLNLWDGVRETPGRILIISSNHYDKLDPALIRPGRIDFRLELSYVSRKIISEFYMHFFKKEVDPVKLSKIKDNLYTPCEITNIYIKTKRNENDFMKRLMRNERVKTQ